MPTALQIVRNFYPEVDSITDSKSNLDITISTQLANSKAIKQHNKCVVAEACKKEKNFDGAVVALTKVYLVKGNKAIRYDVPESLEIEIKAFDKGGRFAPGEYRLEKPYHKLGTPRAPMKVRTVTGATKKYRHITKDVRIL